MNEWILNDIYKKEKENKPDLNEFSLYTFSMFFEYRNHGGGFLTEGTEYTEKYHYV
jgi:hypothetical protein